MDEINCIARINGVVYSFRHHGHVYAESREASDSRESLRITNRVDTCSDERCLLGGKVCVGILSKLLIK